MDKLPSGADRPRRPPDDRPVDGAAILNDPPQFDLAWEVDDPVEPSEVTLFDPAAVDAATRWITADVDWVLPLDEAV